MSKPDNAFTFLRNGVEVTGTFQEAEAAIDADRAAASKVIKALEVKVAAAQVATPAKVIERVAIMSKPQLTGLQRAIAARTAQLQSSTNQQSRTASTNPFIGETGLARVVNAMQRKKK